jgi:MFS family permease
MTPFYFNLKLIFNHFFSIFNSEMDNLVKDGAANLREEASVVEGPKKKQNCGEVTLTILKNTTNFSLLKENFNFFLITMSNFFIFLVYFIPFIYIPVRAQQLGIENYPWILSIIGIVNIPVRIIFGFLADRKFVSAINMNTLCTLTACLILFTFYALTTFWMQACFAVLFAIAIAGMNCLATPYLVASVGSDKFSNANGILNMFRGIGCIIGPYVAGYLSESTGSVFYSFFFAGVSYFVAFGLSLAVSVLQFVETRRQAKKARDEPNTDLVA